MNSNNERAPRMGWLTESAFIPKESKKINLDQHSSLVNLKAKLLEERTRLSQKQSQPQAPQVSKNAGVEERALKDAQHKPPEAMSATEI